MASVSIAKLISQGVEGETYRIAGTVQSSDLASGLTVRDGSTVDSVTIDGLQPTDDFAPWTTLEATGQLKSLNPARLRLSQYRIHGVSDKGNPLEQGEEQILQHPHLRLRMPWQAVLMRFRSATVASISDYFNNHPDGPFHQVHHPMLTHTDCEGGAEVFPVLRQSGKKAGVLQQDDYFGGRRYLSVTAAIHGEAFTMGLDRVWMLAPSFRAERVSDNRHLAEFWMLEISMNYIEALDPLFDLCEDFARGLVERLRRSAAAKELMVMAGQEHTTSVSADELQRRWDLLCQPNWPRISHAEATKLMQDAVREGRASFQEAPGTEIDFSSEHELFLLDHFKRPIFVTHYPTKIRLFSALQSPAPEIGQPQTTESIDLLLPGVAEVFSGGLREHRLDKLVDVMRAKYFFGECEAAKGAAKGADYPFLKEGESLDSLQWFADLRRWGTTPHGGFGIGFERLLVYLTGAKTTKEVIAFPRYYQGCFA